MKLTKLLEKINNGEDSYTHLDIDKEEFKAII
jgi:hypothetical protein